jgi:hypothetical protein
MNIVIIGRFSPPVLACIRSWGRQGHTTGFIWIDGGSELKPRSKFLHRYVRLHPDFLLQDTGIDVIKSFLEQFDADILTCVDDNLACWLNDHITRPGARISLALPSSRSIRKILSKTFQNRLAVQTGFTVLDEYVIDFKNQDLVTIDPKHFPLCLRPSEPDHVKPYFKVKLIHSPDELNRFIKTLMIEKEGNIIGQPFKNLPNLVVHGIRTNKGEVKYLFPFIVERKFEGVTLTLRPYPDMDINLLGRCRRFVNAAGITGPFHFEFLLDTRTRDAFFLEINARFGGTTAKVAACGYDEPMYALEAYGIQTGCRPSEITERTISNKQALLKYMGKAIFKNLTPLDYPEESAKKIIFAGIKGLLFYHDEVLCLDDVKGGINLYLNNMVQIFFGIFHVPHKK